MPNLLGAKSLNAGFIQLTFLGWVAVITGVVILGLTVALKFTYSEWQDTKREFAEFTARVKVIGDAQERATKRKVAADIALQKRIDDELKELRSRAASLAKRLRDARSSGSYVPPASPGSKRPDLACFDRGELDRATRQLDEGLSGIAEICDQRTLDLDSAKRWARDR